MVGTVTWKPLYKDSHVNNFDYVYNYSAWKNVEQIVEGNLYLLNQQINIEKEKAQKTIKHYRIKTDT